MDFLFAGTAHYRHDGTSTSFTLHIAEFFNRRLINIDEATPPLLRYGGGLPRLAGHLNE
jgi:hypothetical protein